LGCGKVNYEPVQGLQARCCAVTFKELIGVNMIVVHGNDPTILNYAHALTLSGCLYTILVVHRGYIVVRHLGGPRLERAVLRQNIIVITTAQTPSIDKGGEGNVQRREANSGVRVCTSLLAPLDIAAQISA